MKKIIYTCGFALIMLFTSCNDFLNEPATKEGVLPTSISDLVGFYNSYLAFDYNEYRTYISDDMEFPLKEQDIINNKSSWQKRIGEFYALYFRRDLRQGILRGGYELWNRCYSDINKQNYVLSMADDKTLEGSNEERNYVKAQARFRRAMSMFDLATNFCMPYSPGENDNGLGLVLKSKYSLDMTKENLSRSNLKDTYEFIENDILASIKDTPEGDETWRITKKATYAFAARFFLMIGKYSEAQKYADLALTKNNQLEDYTSFQTKEVTTVGRTLDVIPFFYDVTTDNDATIRDLKELYYIQTYSLSDKPFFPSQKLINLYQNDAGNRDVRFWNMNPDAGAVTSNFISHTSQKQFRYYTGYTRNGAMIVSPDVPEMILIKAECLAEDNKLDQAKAELNKLRSKRIKNYDPNSVNNLSSKDDVLNFIYDERRREKPFYLRGFDIRRLNAIKHKNIVVEKHFFEISATEILINKPKIYRLEPNDSRYADLLYDGDVRDSEGFLEQNQ